MAVSQDAEAQLAPEAGAPVVQTITAILDRIACLQRAAALIATLLAEDHKELEIASRQQQRTIAHTPVVDLAVYRGRGLR